jgi:hypothetical protein
MQVTIEIPERVVQRAVSSGLTPEQYVQRMFPPDPPELSREERIARAKEFLERFPISGLPQLPPEAYHRSSFYED